MNVMPILVMDGILLVITVLLALADRLLVTYGECKITVTEEGETKTFRVQGGDYLHAALKECGINVSSSCGGKATCGYCKVHVMNGGGPVLPTEEVFLSRDEKLHGVRLSCQVKVKQDIEIFIPDFLTTVRSIVDNELFDPKLKWRFKKGGLYHDLDEKGKVKFKEEEEAKAHEIVEKHRDAQESLVPLLQDVNAYFNYLPEAVFSLISNRLRIPVSSVYRVATFYNAFSLKPRGKHTIAVCLGTACHVKGAGNILAALERGLGIKSGETTEDMRFSLEPVRCIGCCGLAPVVTVGEDVHGHMSVKKVTGLIETYREASANVQAAS